MSIYKNYGFVFVLEFEELSEDLQEKKINEVIDYWFKEGVYDEQDYPTTVELEELEDEARRHIERRFPMYF